MTTKALCDSHHVGCLCTFSTLIKTKIKFSSYIWKFRMKQLQRSYMTITASSYEYMGKYLRISSYIRKPFATLQLLHSEFPYRWGKFYFLFYQCKRPPTAAAGIARRSQLSSPSKGRWVRSIKAGGVDRPSQYKLNLPGHSPPAELGRTPCWAALHSIRPLWPLSLLLTVYN